MSSTYIYTMHRVNLFRGPEKQVLRDISLSFFPGAKIGVLGPNGAGKSSLLKIMAGELEPSNGRAELAPGARVGMLPQEPQLDSSLDVRGNVELGVAEKRELLDRFAAISARFAEPMTDEEMTALLEEQGEVQDRIDRTDAWNLDQTLDVAMDALRLPPADAAVDNLSGGEKRRVALCRLLLSSPDLLLLDEPTNHLDAESVAWLEQFLERFEGTVLAVTHDRYFLDNVAGWILELDRGHGIPFQGNYSSWLEQKQARLASRRSRSRRAAGRWRASWSGCGWRPARATPSPRPGSRHTRRCWRRRRTSSWTRSRSTSRAGPRLGDVVVEADARQGVRRPAADRVAELLAAAGRDRRRDRPQRRRQDDAVPDDRRRGAARRRHRSASAIPSTLAYVDQARADLDPAKTVWEEISGGHDRIAGRHPRDRLAGLRGVVQLPRPRPAEAGRRPVRAASATACTWPSC